MLVDPKQVELNHYEAIPHLLTPVITSPRMAANALQNLVREMEWRYGDHVARPHALADRAQQAARRGSGEKPLPYILCVIDELADLMMVAPADVEDSIIRLAQKARAVGIHLVLATQSPRVDVITGMIKANVPSRIAFAVSLADRLARDPRPERRRVAAGAGRHALLAGRLRRGCSASRAPTSTSRRSRRSRTSGPPGRARAARGPARGGRARGREKAGGDDEFDPDEDPLLGDAIQLVVEMGTASTSMLQRRLRLGYTRAGRLIDMLERRGVISGYEGSKPRQVLVDRGRPAARARERWRGARPTSVDAAAAAPVPDEPTLE